MNLGSYPWQSLITCLAHAHYVCRARLGFATEPDLVSPGTMMGTQNMAVRTQCSQSGCHRRSHISDLLCMQDVMMLNFTPEATGMTWKEYINLYCAGAKQLFMHETPKYPLQFGPAPTIEAPSEGSCIACILFIQKMLAVCM